MIITCEECKTSYNLDASQLQPAGSKVRCTNCKHVFTAFPPPDEAPALVKAEPVADAPVDTPTPQTPVGTSADDAASEENTADMPDEVDTLAEVDMLDADDLFEIDEADSFGQDTGAGTSDDDEFDLASEDFDLPGNDVAFADDGEPSEADLQLTDDDLDLVMDMAPSGAVAPSAQTALQTETAEAPAPPESGEFEDLLEDAPAETAVEGLNAANESAVTASDFGGDLDLEDLDLGEGSATNLVSPPDSSAAAPELEGADELDLDLDLDLDLGDDDAPEDAAADTPLEEALSLDEELSLEEADTPEMVAPADESAVDDLDLEIEDLDLEFDMDTSDDNDAEVDLALELDDDAVDMTPTDTPAVDENLAETADDGLDLDLDFDLEEENSGTAEEASKSEEGDPLLELDLGDMEETPAASGDDDDFSLDLDNLELMDEEPADPAGEADDGLELDLGGDLELAMDDDQDQGSAGAEDEDLDLADLEGLLDDAEAGKAAAADEDLSLEGGSLFGDEGDASSAAKEASFDLSELESILDEDEEGGDEGFSLEEEPELDLDLESTPTLTSEEDDLDLSDFEYLAEDGETAPSDDHFDSGDMELEFEVDDEGASALKEADAEIPPLSEPEAQPVEPEIVPESAPPSAPAGPAPVPKKRGTSKLLIAVLIIVLLLGGGYCAYVLLDGMGIRIPYLSDYLKPEANDPGNLQMTTFDINSRFVDSQVLGRIFVITGKVKNGYDHPRGFVQLTGKLFTKGKNLASDQTVYAGNLISDMDLVNLSAEELGKRLNNRFGNNRMNSRVQPGKALPFMVVFSKLPEAQLEEFTIEVDTSTALK